MRRGWIGHQVRLAHCEQENLATDHAPERLINATKTPLDVNRPREMRI